MAFPEIPQAFEAPHIPFPENPKIIQIDNIPAYEYIPEKRLAEIIDGFSQRIDLSTFDAIGYNLNGGKYFFDELMSRQRFTGQTFPVEYHESGEVVTPVPYYLIGRNIAVVDDVLDRYITGSRILADAKKATLLYLTRKRVTPTDLIRQSLWASEVDAKWLLGAGMNGEENGDGLPDNWGRTFRGIAAKILPVQ